MRHVVRELFVRGFCLYQRMCSRETEGEKGEREGDRGERENERGREREWRERMNISGCAVDRGREREGVRVKERDERGSERY